jgi:lipopolysaccharide export system permease protein
MIFRRSLVREMTVQALALFLVLLGILFTNLMLRLLALAAGGTVAPEGLVALLGFNALFYFNILVSVTVFTTVLLTLVRWYRDSEMIVWLSSGIGLADCLRPILFFAAPFFLVITVLSLFLSPWAMQRKLEYERQLESRDEIALITPGLFREFGRANLVVFVESVNTFDGSIKNVFLQSVEDGKDATTVARSGALQVAPNGDRFIVLDDGRRYEGKAGSADFRVIEFGSLGRRIEPAELRALPSSTKAIPTAMLMALDGPTERAELFWRISIPIASIVLTLLAVPLAYVNPRIGTWFNIIGAVFLYMLYSNCLSIVQSFIAQGKLGFLPGLVIPHAIAIGLVLLLYGHRLSLFGLFTRRQQAKATAAAG